MNDYIEVRFGFKPCTEEITDVAAALLADAGFESFVPDAEGLTAYIRRADGETISDFGALLAEMPFDTEVTVDSKIIKGQDWNSEWEKHYFKPIVIDSRCVVHSSFHTDVPEAEYDIVIDPKMAFGTGHHATTTLIVKRLLSMDLKGARVIDVGTGTGILAILAAMRGASEVTGIEIDSAAYENAVENVNLNGHSEIRLVEGDASALSALDPGSATLLTANINRNVITADLPAYAKAMVNGGVLIFSGFYTEDIPVVRSAAEACGLVYEDFIELDNWVSVRFRKP